MGPRLLFGLFFLSGCGETDTLSFNDFKPPAPVTEVVCPGPEPWTSVASPIQRGLSGVWGPSKNNLFAVGGGGAIFRYDGSSWSDASPALINSDLLAVHGSAADDVWVVGRGGLALHFDGSRFEAFPTGHTQDLVAVQVGSETEAWIAGAEGLSRWDGSRFVRPEGAPTAPLNALWRAPNGQLWMSSNTSIFHYDGSRFTEQPIAHAKVLSAVFGARGAVFAVGHGDSGAPGFASLEKDGWAFGAAPPRAVFFSLFTLNGSDLFVGASDTSIFRRTDGGWCREHLAKTGALNAIFSTGPLDPFWAVGAIRGSGGGSDPVLLKRPAF